MKINVNHITFENSLGSLCLVYGRLKSCAFSAQWTKLWLSVCFWETDRVLLHWPALRHFSSQYVFLPWLKNQKSFFGLENKPLNPTKCSSYLLFLYFPLLIKQVYEQINYRAPQCARLCAKDLCAPSQTCSPLNLETVTEFS